MKKWIRILGVIVVIVGLGSNVMHAEEVQNKHNWRIDSEDYHEIEAGTHEISYWKNLMRYNRTCSKTHIIRTVVYYCNIHGHTKSEIFLHDTKHSLNHGE